METACQSWAASNRRSEEHTSELQSQSNLVCRLLLEKKKKINNIYHTYTTNCNSEFIGLLSIHSLSIISSTAAIDDVIATVHVVLTIHDHDSVHSLS